MAVTPATLLRRAVNPARHAGSPRTVLVVMCVGYFLVLLDVTIVNVALPAIGSRPGTDVGGLQWVVDGYALALAALMLNSGTAGDLYGHRRVVLGGLVVFGAGSLACGLAPGVPVLVAARVVQGVGAALLLPGTLAIISMLVRAGAHTGYAVLSPAFLLWGVGMGFLTPAVVAAAIAAVPARRSGLASAVNNTARQTGGAIGIAVAGAIAGPPTDGPRFVRGFHAVALGAAGLHTAAAVLALAVLPGALLPVRRAGGEG
ncbi:MFS transporter [Streptomyces sp. MAI_2237]